MTVPAGSNPYKSYPYTGPNNYSFPFRMFETSDVTLKHLDTDGIKSNLTERTDYTVTLIDDGDNGCTCAVTLAETDGHLEMTRTLPKTQESDWQNAGPFNAELLEDDLDRVVLLIQDLAVKVDQDLIEVSWAGEWQDTYAYTVGDVIQAANNNWYVCISDHTSSSDFDADLADGSWALAFDVTYLEQLTEQAAQSEANATASETAAAASETAAATSETNAAASETAAAASETAAAASETATEGFKDDAETAATAAEAIVALGERVDSVNTDFYTATASQTAFTITEPAPEDNILVFMNSRKLRLTDDYTLDSPTSATTMTLNSGADVGDEIEMVSFNVAILNDLVSDSHPEAHTVASHSDTTMTGVQANELVQSLTPTALHQHQMLSAPTDTGVVYVNGVSNQVEIGSNYNLVVLETGNFGALISRGNISVNGTVDGRDVAADGANIDRNTTHTFSDGSDHADVAANSAARHAESHTVASHLDTRMTGAQANELVQTTNPVELHQHQMLSARTDTGVVYVNDASSQVEIGSSYNLAVAESGIFGNIECYGNISVNGTVDGRDVAADGAKLDSLVSGDFSSNVEVTNTQPQVNLFESDTTDKNFSLLVANGIAYILYVSDNGLITNTIFEMNLDSTKEVTFSGPVVANDSLNVTGHIYTADSLTVDGVVLLPGILSQTTDPGIAGALWCDGTDLKISVG